MNNSLDSLLARHRKILGECFHFEVSSIELIGEGTYRVFEVNKSLIFRLPR